VRLYDQHLHSWNSFDSQTPPAENVESAIDAGLAGLTFTEHFDTHPTEWNDCVYNDEKITSEIRSLREQYGDQIFIGKGIEICYQPERMDFIVDFLEAHQFDLVIASVHWAFGRPVHEREQFADMDADAYLRFHLDAVRAATEHIVRLAEAGRRPFDVLGHLDFAKRYTRAFYGQEHAVNNGPVVDAILSNCIASGLIPEINTSTLRNNLSAPMPGAPIIKRYAELGGTMMTLGSDAHRARCIGSHFADAVELMRQAGLHQVAVFHERQVEALPIE
jgi:histidinol-phosphatase (PHP family)